MAATTAWVGQDGNLYYGSGTEGSGVDNMGTWAGNYEYVNGGIRSLNFDTPLGQGSGFAPGVTMIDDPLGPAPTGATGGNSAPVDNRITQGEIDASRDNTVNAGSTLLGGKSSEYDTNSRNFQNKVTDTQDAINTNSANNALSLRRSMSSIAGGVRQGIRSGGVMLANMGASDSGAAQAMANAYATEGNNLSGDANNQFELQDQQLVGQQNILNRDKEQGLSDLTTWKATETNKIKGSLTADLSTLAATAAANGRGGVDMGVVDQLVNNALTQMAAVDARTAGAVRGSTGYSRDQANTKAAEMDARGEAGSNPFSTAGVDMFQPAGASGANMTGAPITQIPLRYTKRNY